MGMFDYALNNFDPYQGGLLGALGNNNLAGLARSYGGYRQPWETPQDPLNGDPSGSTPLGGAPQNPYGNQNALMPSFSSAVSTEGQPQQAQNAPWLRPGSFFDRLFGQPQMTANAAPTQQPNMSGAEPSAAWTGATSQTANVPMPPMRPPQPPQQSGVFSGDGSQSSMGGGYGGGAFPSSVAQSALPPNAQPTQGTAPSLAQPQAPRQNPLQSLGSLFSSMDPSNRPTLQETGVDPFTGQKTFAWVNPQNQTLTPATMGAGQPGTAQPQSLGAFSEAVRSGVSGDALYQHLPAEMRNTVKAMIEGRAPLPSAAAMRNPQVMALINAANAIDPSFDATEWGKRGALVKNYLAGGKQFQEMQAIGTVSGHLVNLMKSADALGNTDYPMYNGIVNWLKENTGNPQIDKFKTDLHAVSNELSRAYRGGHVTEGDVKAWNDSINAAKSPAQLKAVIGELNDLLKSKRERLEEGYTQGMGKNPLPKEFTAESEASRKNFDSVAKWSGGETAAKSSGLKAGTYNWTPQQGAR